ncbi:SRPBCC family protein [Chloroflexota bacterium]
MRREMSVEIAAPSETVWPLLVEPEKLLKWCTILEEFRYTTEQQGGVGAPCYFKERTGGRVVKCHAVVTEWVENQRLTFKMDSSDFWKDYEETWTLEAMPSGCKATIRLRFELPDETAEIIENQSGERRPPPESENVMTNLKRLAEA